MRRDPESMRVAMVWKTRGAILAGACIAHMLGSIVILMAQTNCTQYPCVDALPFDVWRAVWIFPLFYTPLADFPAQELEYVRDVRLFGWLWVNAVVSCALAVGAWVAGKHARAWWVARRALGRVG